MSLEGRNSGSWGLIIKIDGGEKLSLEQMRVLLKASGEVRFTGRSREETYGWVEAMLNEHGYRKQSREAEGCYGPTCNAVHF